MVFVLSRFSNLLESAMVELKMLLFSQVFY